MPALSFQEEWLDKLLSGSKQHTTRQHTDRIKVGDVCHIYNQQRRRIGDKPLLRTTKTGRELICLKIEDEGTYPRPIGPGVSGIDGRGNEWYSLVRYHAHLLGKVVITEVYNLDPCDAPFDSTRVDWAHADGFDTFADADMWFMKRYGEEWDLIDWTIIKWNGWTERYFEPGVIP
jgi:hypothetical protein